MSVLNPVHYNAYDVKGFPVFEFNTTSRSVIIGSKLSVEINGVPKTFVVTEKEEIPNLVNRIFDITVIPVDD